MAFHKASSVVVAALLVSLALAIGSAEGKMPFVPSSRLPKVFNVGGNGNWTFGLDYASWVFQTGPFLVNDSLSFFYAPFHNVLLFKDEKHYTNCDFSEAQLVGDENQGASGVTFTFKQSMKSYFFGCSEGDEFSHCNAGHMKFVACTVETARPV